MVDMDTCPAAARNEAASATPAGAAEQLEALESAAFRVMSAASQRPFQVERKWCFSSWKSKAGKPHAKGRQYLFRSWAAYVVGFLDLWEGLQVAPACPGRTRKLRELLEAANAGGGGGGSGATPPLSWWEGPWITALADTFSCGFDDAVDARPPPPGTLPADVAASNFAGSRTLQQVWRLSKSYLRGPQKMREKPLRQHDFDLTLYVPFMTGGGGIDAKYSRYMRDGKLRCGWPTYAGPAAWFLLHTFAARIGQVSEACGGGGGGGGGGGRGSGTSGIGSSSEVERRLVEDFKRMLTNFVVNHPCPYCKEHLLSRVSRNDRSWPKLSGVGITFPESSLYPLEWLFAGGVRGGGGARDASFAAKLEAATTASSLSLLVWKLHNAVTSTTEYGEGCRTEEVYDDDALFRCADEADGLHPRMGRAWPFARRFQFWLPRGGVAAWQAAREHKGIRAALTRLHELDGPDWRVQYWTEGGPPQPAQQAKKMIDAVAALDAAMLDAGILRAQYDILAAAHVHGACGRTSGAGGNTGDRLAASLKGNTTTATIVDAVVTLSGAEGPLGPDGNFAFLPDECAVELGKDDDG